MLRIPALAVAVSEQRPRFGVAPSRMHEPGNTHTLFGLAPKSRDDPMAHWPRDCGTRYISNGRGVASKDGLVREERAVIDGEYTFQCVNSFLAEGVNQVDDARGNEFRTK